MCARKLVLEHRAHEAIVEKPRRTVDDVKRLRLWVIGFDTAGRTEHGAVGQGRSARLAGLPLRPAAEEIANRHSVKPISHVNWRPTRLPRD
jgi:hypothetical protein